MKITYYVQRYRPAYEAISKEVRLLAQHFSKRNRPPPVRDRWDARFARGGSFGVHGNKVSGIPETHRAFLRMPVLSPATGGVRCCTPPVKCTEAKLLAHQKPVGFSVDRVESTVHSKDNKMNKVKIYDLHLDGLFNGKWNEKIISHHFVWYPFFFPYTKILSKRSDINHIYTSLGDLPYLNIVDLQNTILTAAASCRFDKVKKRLPLLKKLPLIVTETEFHQKQLEQLGIAPNKIRLIYPPADMDSFSYTPASGKFKILFASCPTRKEDFEKRGINLLLETAPHVQSEILLLWRNGALKDIQVLLNQQKSENILLKNKIVNDMNIEYAYTHATIIPYTQGDDFLKLIPNSALESLAAGKPLLVSTKTELAEIVQRYGCGVVFEPTAEGLERAVRELQKKYPVYQRNCRRTAEELFSKERFLQEYERVYAQMRREKK